AGTYHAWRGDACSPVEALAKAGYADRKGFCNSVTREEIEKHGFVLTPGRYVGAEDIEDDGDPFAEKFARLKAKLEEQFAEGRRLEEEIRCNLAAVELSAEVGE